MSPTRFLGLQLAVSGEREPSASLSSEFMASNYQSD